MRHRFVLLLLFLTTALVHVSTQSLSDRYSSSRPVVIVFGENCPPHAFSDESEKPIGCTLDVIRAVMDYLGVPCRFVFKEAAESEDAVRRGQADLILTDRLCDGSIHCSSSKCVVGYHRTGVDTVMQLRYMGRDRQLIEQMDDAYTRLKVNGNIRAIEEHWHHPTTSPAATRAVQHAVIVSILVASMLLCLCGLLAVGYRRRLSRRSALLVSLMQQIQQMETYYRMEDTQSAHDLSHRHDAMLTNPYVAFSFYDKNGHLIVQNDAMQQLGDGNSRDSRQPLYNADGEVTNYFVAIPCPPPTT